MGQLFSAYTKQLLKNKVTIRGNGNNQQDLINALFQLVLPSGYLYDAQFISKIINNNTRYNVPGVIAERYDDKQVLSTICSRFYDEFIEKKRLKNLNEIKDSLISYLETEFPRTDHVYSTLIQYRKVTDTTSISNFLSLFYLYALSFEHDDAPDLSNLIIPSDSLTIPGGQGLLDLIKDLFQLDSLTRDMIDAVLSLHQPVRKFTEIRSLGMSGRKWVDEKMESADSHVSLILGEPGSGKSTYVINRTDQSKDIVVAFSYENGYTLKDIVTYIAARLILICPEYRPLLKIQFQSINHNDYPNLSTKQLVNFLFSSVSDTAFSGKIIIDAIDECTSKSDTDCLNEVIAQVARLFKNSKIILTSRPGAIFSPSWNTIYLSGAENRKDIDAYIRNILDDERYTPIRDTIINIAGDNFFFAKEMVNDLLSYPKDEDVLSYCPRSFNEYYYSIFKQLFSDIPSSVEVLSVMCAAKEPLNKELLRKVIPGISISFLLKMDRILKTDQDGRILFFHKSIYDFLFSNDAGEFKVDIVKGSQLLFDECFLEFELNEQCSCNGVWNKLNTMNEHFIKHFIDYGTECSDPRLNLMQRSSGFALSRIRWLCSKSRYDEAAICIDRYISSHSNNYSDTDLEARLIQIGLYLDRERFGDFEKGVDLYESLEREVLFGKRKYEIKDKHLLISLLVDNKCWIMIKKHEYESAIEYLQDYLNYEKSLSTNIIVNDEFKAWLALFANAKDFEQGTSAPDYTSARDFEIAHTTYLLGLAYYYMGDYQNAQKTFSSIIKTMSKYKTRKLDLGIAHRMLAYTLMDAGSDNKEEIKNHLIICQKLYIEGGYENTLSMCALFLTWTKYYLSIKDYINARIHAYKTIELSESFSNGGSMIVAAQNYLETMPS